MANVIKYSTSKPSQSSLRKGNLAVGVGDDNYGPTSTTGFVNGMDIPNDGYVVYLLHNNSPAAYVAYNDTDLIAVARTLGNSGTTVTSAKEYLAGRSDTWILNNTPPNIVTDDLILNLDANDVSSYPTTGTTWYDVSGANNNSEMVNGVSFNSGGWIEIDGTDEYINVGPATNFLPLEYHSLEIMVKSSGLGAGMNSGALFGLTYGIIVQILSGGSLSYYVYNTDNGSSTYLFSKSSTGVNLFDNKWHHIVCLRNSSNAEIYIDGELNSSGGNGGTWSGTNIWASMNGRIGDNPNNVSYNLFGSLNSPRIYNKALSSSEILQNYYQAPIVTDGLVFAIDAGNLVSYENGDTIANSLVVTLPGDLNNGVGFDSNNGGNWVFDGVDDYITLPDTIAIALNGGTEASLNMWVKLNNNSNGAGQSGIIQLSNFNNSNGNLYWYLNGYTYLDIFRTDRVARVWANTVIDPRNWHMLTVTTTPGTNGWKAYLNGILQKQVTGQSTVSVNSTIQGGLTLGESSNNRWLPGNIASCFIYDKALTEDEVTQNYNAQISRFQ